MKKIIKNFMPLILFSVVAEGNGVAETKEAKAAKAEKDALLASIKEQNKVQIDGFKDEFKQLMQDSKAGLIDEETFNTKFADVTEKLKDFDPAGYKTFQTTLEKYEGKLREQGTELAKLKESGTDNLNDVKERFWGQIKEALSSETFKDFVESNGKKKASFPIKAVSVGANYTGTSLVHITSRDSRVVDHPKVERLNVRDLLTVTPADLPYLAFIEVYDWDRNVGVNTENGTLSESSFKVREATVDVKRIGTHVPLSKRMLRSVSFILAHLQQMLPAMVRYYEDFQLLWGDGAGNNVLGIAKVAQDFTTLINTSVTGGAGTIASIASYDSGLKTLLTFTDNTLVNNGDVITIAGAVGQTQYNAAHRAIVIGPKEIVLEVAYGAESTAAYTFTINSPFKLAIPAAQQIDVLKVAKSLVTIQHYACTGFVINPVDATLIESLKDSTEQYIDVKRQENGVLTIAGVPVVETTAMPAGKFAAGDWAMAAAIGQFSELVLEFSESTQEKLTNTVEAIIQEEILFPIYNKYMFVMGDFATGTAAILKP